VSTRPRSLGSRLGRVIPAPFRPLVRELYRTFRACGPRGLALAVYELVAVWRGPVLTIDYKGFVLFYGRRMYLIPWARGGRTWEAPVADGIARELRRAARPVFVDVGANIGLMTLNVLSAQPSTRVFAFEPAAHQYGLLARTIAANRLEDRVTVYPVALGDQVGTKPFALHDTRYNALDGFVDTGRAPLKTVVTVDEETLDHWWQAAGCPPISVIKIDTEGAELWILRGAVDVLARARPVIFLEIQPANLRGYAHGAADVVHWLHAHGYRLDRLDGTPVEVTSLERLLRDEENFVARPSGPAGKS